MLEIIIMIDFDRIILESRIVKALSLSFFGETVIENSLNEEVRERCKMNVGRDATAAKIAVYYDS
jgi:hypothetical protein